MPYCKSCSLEMKKLLKFLEKIKVHSLGLDWESKRELKEIENKVVEKIKNFKCLEAVK
jgi:hypothetical protein